MVPDRKGLALITQRPGPGVTGPAGWLSSISPRCEEGLLAPGPRFHSSPARYAAGELAARGAVAWLSRPSLSDIDLPYVVVTSPVSPGLMSRPSLSVISHRGWQLTQSMSPGLMPWPSLSDSSSDSGLNGGWRLSGLRQQVRGRRGRKRTWTYVGGH